MSRATRKISRLSLKVRENLIASASSNPRTTGRNKRNATWIVLAADYTLDLLVATNENAASLTSKGRVKAENKQLANAFENLASVKLSWILLAHGMVVWRRDNAVSPKDRASEHLCLRLLNGEFPLGDDGRQWLDASRHSDPWVRDLDSQAMSAAYGAFAAILGPESARTLALFDEDTRDLGWAGGYMLSAQWLGAASKTHLDQFHIGDVDETALISETIESSDD